MFGVEGTGVEAYCTICGEEWRETEWDEPVEVCPKCGAKREYLVREDFIDCPNCGNRVYLRDNTNECEDCGALYNAFGQRLRPMDEWEENY